MADTINIYVNLSANESVEYYLEALLGPKTRDDWLPAALAAVYALIFATGLVGNLCTCYVIVRNRRMRTVTNCYLFSLAVADILTLLIGLPPEFYSIFEAYPWRFGEPYCLLKTFMTETTSSASVLTITCFTVERYMAICHSLKMQTMSGVRRAVKNIAIIWMLAMLSALPYPLHTRVFPYVRDQNGSSVENALICNIPEEWRERMAVVFQMSTFALFVLPMLLITILYVKIGLALKQASRGFGVVDSERKCYTVCCCSATSSSEKSGKCQFLSSGLYCCRKKKRSKNDHFSTGITGRSVETSVAAVACCGYRRENNVSKNAITLVVTNCCSLQSDLNGPTVKDQIPSAAGEVRTAVNASGASVSYYIASCRCSLCDSLSEYSKGRADRRCSHTDLANLQSTTLAESSRTNNTLEFPRQNTSQLEMNNKTDSLVRDNAGRINKLEMASCGSNAKSQVSDSFLSIFNATKHCRKFGAKSKTNSTKNSSPFLKVKNHGALRHNHHDDFKKDLPIARNVATNKKNQMGRDEFKKDISQKEKIFTTKNSPHESHERLKHYKNTRKESAVKQDDASSAASGLGGGLVKNVLKVKIHSRSRKSALKMLVAVVVAFFTCWAPFHIQRLLTIYHQGILDSGWLDFQNALFYASGILYFVNCTINPILYSLMSLNFKEAFATTLRCHDSRQEENARRIEADDYSRSYFRSRMARATSMVGAASELVAATAADDRSALTVPQSGVVYELRNCPASS